MLHNISYSVGNIRRQVLFNIINYLGDGIENTLSNFSDDTKVGEVTDSPGGHDASQRDLNRLERWANKNFMKFNTDKCRVLHFGWNNPRHHYMLRSTQLEGRFAEKDLGILAEYESAMCPCCYWLH